MTYRDEPEGMRLLRKERDDARAALLDIRMVLTLLREEPGELCVMWRHHVIAEVAKMVTDRIDMAGPIE